MSHRYLWYWGSLKTSVQFSNLISTTDNHPKFILNLIAFTHAPWMSTLCIYLFTIFNFMTITKCVCRCPHLWMCMWRPEVGIGHLLLLSNTLKHFRLFIRYVCACIWGHTHTTVHMWRSEVCRLGQQTLHTLSHLEGPSTTCGPFTGLRTCPLWLACLANQLQGATRLCLPQHWATGMFSQAQYLHGFLGSEFRFMLAQRGFLYWAASPDCRNYLYVLNCFFLISMYHGCKNNVYSETPTA